MARTPKQDGDEEDQMESQGWKDQTRTGEATVIQVHHPDHQDQPRTYPGELAKQEVVTVAIELRGHHGRGAENHQRAEQHQHHNGYKQEFVRFKSSGHRRFDPGYT